MMHDDHDTELDTLLAQQQDPVPDDGFSEAVMVEVRRYERRRAGYRAWTLGLSALAGIAVYGLIGWVSGNGAVSPVPEPSYGMMTVCSMGVLVLVYRAARYLFRPLMVIEKL